MMPHNRSCSFDVSVESAVEAAELESAERKVERSSSSHDASVYDASCPLLNFASS